MVKQRLVCPECRLRVFPNSVKCGGCNCPFHTGAEKCARIDTANWSESWCCPDCSSKKMPINKVNSLNSPVLPSPRTPCSPNSRAKMLNILKELKTPVLPPSQKSTLASPYLQHEVMSPTLEVSCQTECQTFSSVNPSYALNTTIGKLRTCSCEVSVQTRPYSYVTRENLTYPNPCVKDFACQTNLDILKPLKDRPEELLSYILTVISEPHSVTQNSDITKNNEVNQVKLKKFRKCYITLCKFI